MRNHRGWMFVGKLLVSLVLVWLLFQKLSWQQIQEAFSQPQWPILGAALLIYGLSAVGGAVQWAWILRVAGISVPTLELHRLYLVGLFFNNFLPANVGGDAVKIFDLGRQVGQPMKVFCATLLDRLLGLSSLTLLALMAVAAASVRMTALPPVYPLFLAMVIWLGLMMLLLSGRVGKWLRSILRRLGWPAVADKMEAVAAEFRLYRVRERWFGSIFAFSLLVQTLRVLTHIFVAWGLSMRLTGDQALQLFVLVPLLGVVLALPISVNGIGLRESVSALTFTVAGFAPQEAVAMQLTAYLVQVVFSLVGGWLFWRGRRERPGRLRTAGP